MRRAYFAVLVAMVVLMLSGTEVYTQRRSQPTEQQTQGKKKVRRPKAANRWAAWHIPNPTYRYVEARVRCVTANNNTWVQLRNRHSRGVTVRWNPVVSAQCPTRRTTLGPGLYTGDAELMIRCYCRRVEDIFINITRVVIH